MIYNIRHHTELAHEKAAAKAATCAPIAQIATIDAAPANEADLGAAMKRMAMKENHKAKLPTVYGSGKTGVTTNLDVGPEILKVLVGKMRATEIARAVSESLGRPVRHQTVSDRLNNQLKDDVVQIRQSKNNVFWRLK